MTVTTYQGWLNDGSPWKPSNPSTALANACKAHGVAYGIIGNVQTHLKAATPEDHCPYSHTPWPGTQPYPYVLAVDLMTTRLDVANRIIAAKRSGRLPCLKYINWTDQHGKVWHTSWEPTEKTVSSTDSGHIHCSWRTDHVLCNHATGFDPFVDQAPPAPEVDVTPEEHTWLQDLHARSNWAVSPPAAQAQTGGVPLPDSALANLDRLARTPAAPTGGLTDADRALIAGLTAAVNALNSRLSTP